MLMPQKPENKPPKISLPATHYPPVFEGFNATVFS
jgi:hypothetical protein